MNRSAAPSRFQVMSKLEAIRQCLLAERFADRQSRPLAYWVLPEDRRLPLAFLGKTLREVLAVPLEELITTPGVGEKKLNTLLQLLHRASTEEVEQVPLPPAEPHEADPRGTPRRPYHDEMFDAEMVSEAMWVRWKDCVAEHGLGDQLLGRLAPTLRELPTVIWHTPLSWYLPYSLQEVKDVKTHGAKRVRVVLEVFFSVYEVLQPTKHHRHLRIELAPAFIAPLASWIASALAARTPLEVEEIRTRLAVPLLDQIAKDAGPRVLNLAEGRLGVHKAPQSVRSQAERLGLTRARVYQLLEECGHVMAVRWPEGRGPMGSLLRQQMACGASSDAIHMLSAACDLCYPPVS
mgnify:CR=1 FL=1